MNHLMNLTEDGNFRRKVMNILKDAEGHGYRLSIYSSLRSKEEQAKKVKQGYSPTMRSKHLAGWDGLARAADIADTKLAWNCHRSVWLMIGRLALTKGLKWGGLWDLPRATRKKLEAFLTKPSTPEDPFDPLEWVDDDGKPGPIGRDPAHVEL